MSDRLIHCAILVAFVLAGGCTRPHSPSAIDFEPASSSALLQASPYANTRSGVLYVGDQACVPCHEDITQSYRRHPMGRSLAAIHAASDIELFGDASNPLFRAGRFQYQATRHGNEMVHRQSVVGSDGTFVTRVDQSIAFVVGSGQRGRSYLINHDGFLFMSPLTWYPQKRIWDLSPGYEQNDLEFSRPILEDCLFCHSNRANLVRHSKNQYAEPVFQGHAIGCERCHGPGELHVQFQQEGTTGGADDTTIVNPVRLEPELREAVCQQCHLAGVARVVRRDKNIYDFRPGLPLESTIVAYTFRSPDREETQHFVGQVEQMYASRCFQASDGQLGCISCHDPHLWPEPQERVRYYANRCLTCHETRGCAVPLEARQDETGLDDCVACHMPPLATDVRHAASTDHRIPRHRDSTPHKADNGLPPIRGGFPIVVFSHDGGVDHSDDGRDLAIALLQTALYYPRDVKPIHFQSVVSSLQQSVIRHPNDVEAKEALADIQRRLGRLRLAAELYRDVLADHPRREHSLVMYGRTLSSLNEFANSVAIWKKAVSLNPTMARYQIELGHAYARTGQWNECRKLAESATSSFPTDAQLRQLLVESYLQTGDTPSAMESLETLFQLAPREADNIREWFRTYPLPPTP